MQRAGKLLEDAQGQAVSRGQRHPRDVRAGHARGHDRQGSNPRTLAQLAIGRMRVKLVMLEEALTGRFDDHHAYLCRMMLDRIDDLTREAAELTAGIEEQIAPSAGAAARLDEIPGVGRTGAQELIAEIGAGMTRFPDAAHLVSRARFAPIDKNSAGKKKPASTGKGNPWPGATIGEIVSGTACTDTFLAERYQRIARRRGKRRAIVAVGNSVLTMNCVATLRRIACPGRDGHVPRVVRGRRECLAGSSGRRRGCTHGSRGPLVPPRSRQGRTARTGSFRQHGSVPRIGSTCPRSALVRNARQSAPLLAASGA
jgi:hypothetical protein